MRMSCDVHFFNLWRYSWSYSITSISRFLDSSSLQLPLNSFFYYLLETLITSYHLSSSYRHNLRSVTLSSNWITRLRGHLTTFWPFSRPSFKSSLDATSPYIYSLLYSFQKYLILFSPPPLFALQMYMMLYVQQIYSIFHSSNPQLA